MLSTIPGSSDSGHGRSYELESNVPYLCPSFGSTIAKVAGSPGYGSNDLPAPDCASMLGFQKITPFCPAECNSIRTHHIDIGGDHSGDLPVRKEPQKQGALARLRSPFHSATRLTFACVNAASICSQKWRLADDGLLLPGLRGSCGPTGLAPVCTLYRIPNPSEWSECPVVSADICPHRHRRHGI